MDGAAPHALPTSPVDHRPDPDRLRHRPIAVRRPRANDDTGRAQQPLPGGLAGVGNFGFVTPDLWRGAQPTADGWASLSALGVRTVINLREEDDADRPAGVAYVHLPTSAWHCDAVDVAAVQRAIAAAPKPVFVHCQEGRDRTGLAVAACRVSTGLSADDACRELRAFGVHAWWRGPIEQRIRSLAAVRRNETK